MKMLKVLVAMFILNMFFLEFLSSGSFALSKENSKIRENDIIQKIILEYDWNTLDRETLEKRINNLVTNGTFDDIYDFYRERYDDFNDDEIFLMTAKNLLSKADGEIDESDESIIKKSSQAIDIDDISYEDRLPKALEYIKLNLSPDYEVTVDSQEENINILEKNYDKLSPDIKKSVDIYLIDTKASLKFKRDNPELVKLYAPGTEKKMTKDSIRRISLFSVTQSQKKARDYADKYYENYNNSYPDWRGHGGDCANFVSQCLYAGDKIMKDRDGNVSDSSNWFSYGKIADVTRVSSSWRGADMFKWHWIDRSYDYRDFYMSDPKAAEMIYRYSQLSYPISVINEGSSAAVHTMIINGFFNKSRDVSLAQHSHSTNNRKVSDFGSGKILRIYKVYD